LVAPASSQPRIRVGALILVDGKVVLARHRKGERTYYLLPGGGVDRGETLADALRREVAEETGLEIDVGPLLFVSDTIDPTGSRHVVNLTFRATRTGGELTGTPADPRVEAVEAVDPASLGALDLRPPFAEELLKALSSPGGLRPAYLGSLFTPER
jgi:8-oxo-dGTP diphosphatase